MTDGPDRPADGSTLSDPSALGRSVYIYNVDTGSGPGWVLSTVGPDVILDTGLCSEAILGTLSSDMPSPDTRPTIAPDRLSQNPAFVDNLATVIAAGVVDLVELRREASRQGDGFVYLLDGRTQTPLGQVPPVDVLGAVAVEGGELVPGSYQHNRHHRLLTADGFFRLPAELEAALATDLNARCYRTRA
jgi:hypothetical protein